MSPESESSTHPLQNNLCFFCSPPGQGVVPTNLLPSALPLEWNQVTHTPTSIKSGGVFFVRLFFFWSVGGFFQSSAQVIKEPPDHYKRLQATSKGHDSLFIEFQSRHYGQPIIHHSWARFAI